MRLGLGIDAGGSLTLPNPLAIMGSANKHWSEWDDSTRVSGNISVVNDKSGNGNTLLQGVGASRPLYVASGISGKGTGRLNGTSHNLECDWFDNIVAGNDSPFSVTAVVNKDDNTSEGAIITGGNTASDARFVQVNMGAAGAFVFRRKDDTGGSSAISMGTYSGTTNYIVTMDFDGSNVRTFKNGSADGTANSDIGNITLDNGRIGVHERTGFIRYFNGDIAAIIVNNRAYQGTERTQVEAYLNQASKYPIF